MTADTRPTSAPLPPAGLFGLWSRLGHDEASDRLGDFTTTRRVVPLSLLAVVIGIVASYVALALLKLIGLFTPLRATASEEAIGMDLIAHGEEAYATGEGAILVAPDGDGEGQGVLAGRI